MKQKTMPNGLGQGGQLEYFGYWIDRDIVAFQVWNLDNKNNTKVCKFLIPSPGVIRLELILGRYRKSKLYYQNNLG